MNVPHRPEDQVFTLSFVSAKEGEPIVLGEYDEILSAEYDSPRFYLVVRTPWIAHNDGPGAAPDGADACPPTARNDGPGR